MNKSKLLLLIIVTIALIAIPITVVQTQNKQNIKQEAAAPEQLIYLKLVQENTAPPGGYFDATLHLINDSSQNITALDATIKYDKNALALENFTSDPASGLSTVIAQASQAEKFHYVAVDVGKSGILKNDTILGTLKFTSKSARDLSSLNLTNASVTILGESGKISLNANRVTNYVGTSTPTNTPTATKTPIPATTNTPAPGATETPTPTLDIIGPVVPTIRCNAPTILSCSLQSVDPVTDNISFFSSYWDRAEQSPLYHIEFCNEAGTFDKNDFTSDKCRFVETQGQNLAITTNRLSLNPYYKIRSRVEKASACTAPSEWSSIKTCEPPQQKSNSTTPAAETVTIDFIDNSHLKTDHYSVITVTAESENGIHTIAPFTIMHSNNTNFQGPLENCQDADRCVKTMRINLNAPGDISVMAAAITNANPPYSIFSDQKEIKNTIPSVFISDITIYPQTPIMDTKVTISAFFKSDNVYAYPQSVKVNIRFQSSFDSSTYDSMESINLYDDGNHGDYKANDGIYANIWDQRNKGAIGSVETEATDTSGNIVKLSKAFRMERELCKEVIPGLNDKNANKINIVFVGANYGDIDTFRSFIEKDIDYNGVKLGLFSQEPFKSNRDKFNFWYVDQIARVMGVDMNSPLLSIPGVIQYRNILATTSDVCVMNNKEEVMYINASDRSFGSFGGGQAFIFTGRNWGSVSGTVLTHELGHSFGNLGDEYVVGSGLFNDLTSITHSPVNIFKGSPQNCMSSNNQWFNLIQKGFEGTNYESAFDSYDPDADLKCKYGVNQCSLIPACFKGATIETNYRPSFNSMMRDPLGLNLENTDRAFGPVNERALCQKIKETVGSAGGICTSDYEIH